MFRLKSSLAAFGVLALLVGAVTLFNPTTGRGQGGGGAAKQVEVVNTSTQPVPVFDVGGGE